MKKVFFSLKAAVCCLVAVFCTVLLTGCGEKTNQSTPSSASQLSVISSTASAPVESSAPAESSASSEPVSSLVEIPQIEPSAPIVPSSSFELDSDLFVHKIVSESFSTSDWKLTFESNGIVFMPAPDSTYGVTGLILVPFNAQYLGDTASASKIETSTAVITGPAGEDLSAALNKMATDAGDGWFAAPDITSNELDMTGTAQGGFWLPYTVDGEYTITFTIGDEAIAFVAPIANVADIGNT